MTFKMTKSGPVPHKLVLHHIYKQKNKIQNWELNMYTILIKKKKKQRSDVGPHSASFRFFC